MGLVFSLGLQGFGFTENFLFSRRYQSCLVRWRMRTSRACLMLSAVELKSPELHFSAKLVESYPAFKVQEPEAVLEGPSSTSRHSMLSPPPPV